MPVFNRVAKMVAKPLPRVLSPKAHAVVDYVRIGMYLAGAGWYWKRSKRAATAALLCATAETALDLLTDYDGRSGKLFSFNVHREIDLGLATMAAMMPEFLAFEDHAAKNMFLAQGALSTAALELTRIPGGRDRNRSLRRRVA